MIDFGTLPNLASRTFGGTHPDGGIARFRLYGQATARARAAMTDRWSVTTSG
jgi:allantoicase